MVSRMAGIGASGSLLDARRRSADRFKSSRSWPAAGPAPSGATPQTFGSGSWSDPREPVISRVMRPSARGFAEHDPAAIAWRGEGRQRGFGPDRHLAGAGGAAELLDAVG